MGFKTVTFSADGENALIPAWKDYVNHYRAVNYAKKTSYSSDKTLEEKANLIEKAMKKEISILCPIAFSMDESAYISNPQYKWATFAVVNKLVDTVMPAIVSDDFMGIANTQTIGYGDSAVFDIKSADLFTVTKNGHSRRHVEVQKQFTGTKALVPTNRTVTTEIDLYRVLAGKESLADYAMKVTMSIESEIAIDIMSAIKSTYSTLVDNFKENGWNETQFKKLATRVSASNGGAKTICMGTELGLANILPTNDYLKMGIGDEYNKIGYLPMYKNVPLIAINQKIDASSVDYDFALDDNYLYFLSPQGQKLVQVVFEGNSLSIADDQFDNENLTQKVSIHKSWAVGVITNSKYGIMKLA